MPEADADGAAQNTRYTLKYKYAIITEAIILDLDLDLELELEFLRAQFKSEPPPNFKK